MSRGWWQFRWMCLFMFVSFWIVNCETAGGVGWPCKINVESIAQLKKFSEAQGSKPGIAENTFECELLPYCIATQYLEEKKDSLGYCTRVCTDKTDCPDTGGYTCEEFLPLPKELLPPEFQAIGEALSGRKLCIRTLSTAPAN